MRGAPNDGEKHNLSRAFRVPPPFFGRATRMTHRRVQNYIQSNLERLGGNIELASYPSRLTVEATNLCNLKCPACYTGMGEVGRPRGELPLEAYRRLLGELGPYLFEVEFYNWGEPLLASALCDMIQLTQAAGVSTTVSTNFSFRLDPARAERLVSAGLTVLGVSIDGATQASYEKYRVGGNLERVLDNCRMIAEIKARLGSPTPALVWEFHVFSHNVDEVDLARQMAREIGMEIAVDKGFVLGPDWDPEERFRFFLQPPPFPERCNFLWQHAVVNNDGGVSPCPGTFYREDDVGRLELSPDDGGEQTFASVWNGERLQRARALFESRDGETAARHAICHDCPRTVVWEEWKSYLRSGDPPMTFRPTVKQDVGEWVNFLWNHRQRTTPAERGLVPLRRKPPAT